MQIWLEKLSMYRTHWIIQISFKEIQTCEIGQVTIQTALGFRDIRLFNQALLARQAWRLIEFPDSLCSRLLKAKYFPNGDLLDTAFPNQVSPTWRSIMHGLERLKKGAIWRVGRGTEIEIWRDALLHKKFVKADKIVFLVTDAVICICFPQLKITVSRYG